MIKRIKLAGETAGFLYRRLGPAVGVGAVPQATRRGAFIVNFNEQFG